VYSISTNWHAEEEQGRGRGQKDALEGAKKKTVKLRDLSHEAGEYGERKPAGRKKP